MATIELVLIAAFLQAASAAYSDVFQRASVSQFHHGAFQDVSDSIRSSVNRFLHWRGAEIPFDVPLEINVVLLGFNGDGGYRYTLDAVKLKDALNQSMPRHRPACLETSQRLAVEQRLYYNVIPAGQVELLAVESHLKAAMVATNDTSRETEFGKLLPLYEIEAASVEPLFDSLYQYIFGVEAHANADTTKHLPVAVFILNLDKVRMDPRTPVNDTASDSNTINKLTTEELALQEGGYIYKYRYNGGASTQLWLSSGRYAIVDLAAGPCAYGKVDSHEGNVGFGTVPRLQSIFFSRGRPQPQESKTQDVFSGQLAALVASAVEHMISPDVRYETVDVAKRLLVSVIVLRNHMENSLLHSGGHDAIDMHAIEREVRKLAEPGQEVVVVGGTHNLHDHEKLAIAVRKSLRSLSTHESTKDGRYQVRVKSYLDGSILREEFKLSADVLASGLLELADPSLSNKFFHYMDWQPDDEERATRDPVIKSSTQKDWIYDKKEDKETRRLESRLQNPPTVKKAHGTRVVPVFVLSLAGVDEELLMEGDSPVWTSNDAVFVVQHESAPFNLSYVSETARRQAVPSLPHRHIIAGLAEVVGGLVAPYEKASHVHERPLVNWLWASGHHPFGPFSNTSEISRLQADTALRNSIYARVDGALRAIRQSTESVQSFTDEFLRSPLGEPVKDKRKQLAAALWLDKFYKKTTNLPMPIPHELVQQLETYLDELEKQLVEVSSLMFNHQLLEAHQNSTNLLHYTTFAKAYVEHVLETERNRLRCCHVEYSMPIRSSQALIYGVILLAGFVIYFVVISLSGDKWY